MQFQRVGVAVPRAARLAALGAPVRRGVHAAAASASAAQQRALERLEERAKRAMNLALTSSLRRQGGGAVAEAFGDASGGGRGGSTPSDAFLTHPARRQLEEVHALWTTYQQEGYPLSPTMYSIAIQLHAEMKNWGLGLRLFKMHAGIDWRVSGLKAAMWCAAQCGDVNALLAILRKIEERRATVNRRMLELLFTTCVRAGEPARAYAVLQQLLARGGGLSASAYSAIMANALEMNEADRGVAALRDQVRHLASTQPGVRAALASWHGAVEAGVKAALLQGLASGAEPPALQDVMPPMASPRFVGAFAAAGVPGEEGGAVGSSHGSTPPPPPPPLWSAGCCDPSLDAHLRAAMPLLQRCWAARDIESLITGLRTLQATGHRLPRGTVDMLLAEASRASHPFLAEFCIAELVLSGQPLSARHANTLAKAYADADDLEGAFRTMQLMADYGARANAYAGGAGSEGAEGGAASTSTHGGAGVGVQSWAGEWLVTDDTLAAVQNAISRLFTLVETFRKEASNGLGAFNVDAATAAATVVASAAEAAAAAAASAYTPVDEAAAAGYGADAGVGASADPADDAALYGLDGSSAPSGGAGADLWSLVMGGDASGAEQAAGTNGGLAPLSFATSGTDSESDDTGMAAAAAAAGLSLTAAATAAKAAQVAAAAGIAIHPSAGAAGSGAGTSSLTRGQQQGGAASAPTPAPSPASLQWRAGLLLGLDYDGSSSLSDAEGGAGPGAGAPAAPRDAGPSPHTSASAALREMFTGQGVPSKAWAMQPLAGAGAGLDSPAILLSLALHGAASALALGPSWPLAMAHHSLRMGKLWLEDAASAAAAPLPLEDSTMTFSRALCGLREGRHFFSVRLKDFFALSSSGAPLAPAPAPNTPPLSSADRLTLQRLVPSEVAAHYTGLYAFTSPAGIVPGGRPLTPGPLVSAPVFNSCLAGLAAGRGGSLVSLAVRIAAAEAYYGAPAADASAAEDAEVALALLRDAGAAPSSSSEGADRDSAPGFSPDFIGESHFGGDSVPVGGSRKWSPASGGWGGRRVPPPLSYTKRAPASSVDPDQETATGSSGSTDFFFGSRSSGGGSGSGGLLGLFGGRGRDDNADDGRGAAAADATSADDNNHDDEDDDDSADGGAEAHTTVFSLVPASTRRFNQDTYAAQFAAAATASSDALPASRALFEDLVKRGLTPTPRVYAALVQNLVRCGRSSLALDVLFHAARGGRPPPAPVFEAVARGLVSDAWVRVVNARPNRRYTLPQHEGGGWGGSSWQRVVDDVSRTVKRVLRAPDTAVFGGAAAAPGGPSESFNPFATLAAVLGKCVGGSREPAVDAELAAAGKELAALLELSHRVGYVPTLPLTVSLAASLACVDVNELPAHLRPAAAAMQSGGGGGSGERAAAATTPRPRSSWRGAPPRDGGYSSRAKAVDLE